MRTARELCDLHILSEKSTNYEYDRILREFGKVLIQTEDQDYQGNSYVLYENDKNQFGFLQFGWGSCSGCDALQACDSVEDLQRLMDHLFNSIIWFDSKEALYKFVNEHDWEMDLDFNQEAKNQFIGEVTKFVNNGVLPEKKCPCGKSYKLRKKTLSFCVSTEGNEYEDVIVEGEVLDCGNPSCFRPLFDEHYENLLKEVVRVYEEKHRGGRIPKIESIN